MERAMHTDCRRRFEASAVPLDRGAELDDFLRGIEKRAFRIAVISVRDGDEALEIVQEAMLSLALSYSRRPSAEWRPLFYKILKNKIWDWHRRATVRSRIGSLFGFGHSGEDDPLAAAPAPAEVEPEEQLQAEEAFEAVAKGIRQLPRRQREAFMLRNLEGLNVAETAFAMGCSEGSVKTHLSRALTRLRALLGDDWR